MTLPDRVRDWPRRWSMRLDDRFRQLRAKHQPQTMRDTFQLADRAEREVREMHAKRGATQALAGVH